MLRSFRGLVMTQFIDRRPNSRKNAVNRQRFLRRFRGQIKKSVSEAISRRSITDIDRGEKITIPAKDIYEPKLRHGQGGYWEIVHPGNKEFVVGDHVKRETEGSSGAPGSQASNTGIGLDDFGFELSREEFLDLFFEDLALPNLIKKQLTALPTYKLVRAGFTHYGTPANIDVIRSLRMAHSRRIALGGSLKEKLNSDKKELAKLLLDGSESDPTIVDLKREIEQLESRLQKLPFIDPFDLRYRHHEQRPLLTTQAVMFCLMDVSGSMDEVKKEIAKRFFILLYLFIRHNYERVDIVFVRHHTTAKEVDEQEFFYSRETGGTVVSSALEMMKEIINRRYPMSDWNIYAAQASDGDNWSADSPYCQELLINSLMPKTQYFAYVEIMPRYHQSLWEAYLPVKDRFSNFAMQTINDVKDIYSVFHELFKRQVT